MVLMTGIYLFFFTWLAYSITSRYPAGIDFYERWRGSNAFWVEGLNPYSPAVTHSIEMGMYGQPADPGQKQFPGDFLYPFHVVVILAPLSVVPYELAEAVWAVLTATLCVISFVAMTDLFKWRYPRWLLVFGVLWSIFFYPSMRGIIIGQIGTVVGCLLIISFWAQVKGYDRLAGILLALSTMKPQVVLLAIPFLLLYGLFYRRWRFLWSAALTFIVLVGVSFILLPSWLGDFLNQVLNYHSFTVVDSTIKQLVIRIGLPPVSELVISGLLFCVLLWAWYQVLLRGRQDRAIWTVALTFTLSNLILSPTATPHFVVLIIVFVFYFAYLARLQWVWGPILALVAMAFSIVLPWWLAIATLDIRAESPINYIPLPLISLILLLSTANLWWKPSREFPAEIANERGIVIANQP
jgi:hypothetical protein